MAGGRPTKYNEAIADEICAQIAVSCKGIPTLCEEHKDWPVQSTIFLWLTKHQEFSDKYVLAKKHQADVLTDLMLHFLQKPDTYTDELGQLRNDVGMIRVKIDTIKWQAGKLNPKKYAEKPDTTTLVVKHEDWLKDIKK